MDSYDILVIILSVTLAIFLILAIIATSYLIFILKKAKAVSLHVERTAQNVEQASEKFKAVAGPAAILSLIAKLSKFHK